MSLAAAAVVVTGASGCIGRAVCARLAANGSAYRPVDRRDLAAGGADAGDLVNFTGWEALLQGSSAVIHLAARAHVMRESSSDPTAAFDRDNVAGALRVAEAAASAGARRFVFVSSIGVHGTATHGGPLSEADPPAPVEPYARSKWRAECALAELAARRGLELTIVRPPLVYGPFVKGNMLRLLRLVDRGWPLPFGAVRNRRSFICADNLADVLIRCCTHPAAAGETFVVADGEDLSTRELVAALAQGLGRPALLLPVPVAVLRAAGRVTGRSGEVERLIGDLQVDAGRVRARLGWQPPVQLADGMRAMTRWYCSEVAS
jgi:UDP-glucose 4-epimerase